MHNTPAQSDTRISADSWLSDIFVQMSAGRLSAIELQQQLLEIDCRLSDLELRGRHLEEAIRSGMPISLPCLVQVASKYVVFVCILQTLQLVTRGHKVLPCFLIYLYSFLEGYKSFFFF